MLYEGQNNYACVSDTDSILSYLIFFRPVLSIFFIDKCYYQQVPLTQKENLWQVWAGNIAQAQAQAQALSV